MRLKTLKPEAIAGQTVLVRVDYNVPLVAKAGSDNLVVGDDRRIAQSIETIEFLLHHKARVVLLTHLGRPKSPADHKFSLRPVAEHLERRYRLPVEFIPEVSGSSLRKALEQHPNSSLFMMENLRFHPGEKANDPELARDLAANAQVFVNEAFSSLHRAHASTVGIAKHLPSFAGFGLEREVVTLERLLNNPERPFVALIGGAKISDKVEAIRHLAAVADVVLVGGGVANDFLKAEGVEIYRSFTEEAVVSDKEDNARDFVGVAARILREHRHERMLKDGYIPLPKIITPIDVLSAATIEEQDPALIETIDLAHNMKDRLEQVPLVYADIGPKTTRLYREILSQAGTIFWNGPVGVWENPRFAKGTHTLACVIADSDATTVVGGGDTIAAIDHFGMANSYAYVSTGGGAALELLSGKNLPGLAPLLATD